MAHRIEVASKIEDMRAEVKKKRLQQEGIPVQNVMLADVYTIDGQLSELELRKAASMLSNPVSQSTFIDQSQERRFDFAVEIGFHPGVTDNVGHTAREGLQDILGKNDTPVYTSQTLFLEGDLTREQAQQAGETFANPIIQRIRVKSFEEFLKDEGMGVNVPKVKLESPPEPIEVDVLRADSEELARIGKQGILDPDGSRRGPLAMDITYMQAVRGYFEREKRNPTDVELEMIAQTWSEHCKHTIFADPIDDIHEGLFKTFIRAPTQEIRKRKGEKDFCISVFSDNAGGIIFDNDFLVCDKVETHNSPSALDPFGGSITGIVGVNRDPMGFGMGAKPIMNRYGFCFAPPEDASPLYKDKELKQKMLPPRKIMDGVIDGVNVGGNCSGIPTPQGFVYFDSRYKGKPLVYVGTIGIIPRQVNGKPSHEKQAHPGDLIIMAGGRVGKDGIHGATFSSEAIDAGSPATAVQIGDPITQKKMSDALIKEARDKGMYTSITDNGAGGLSCSVAEMAKESGGFELELDQVPLKYQGLRDDEIIISEAQERMTLSSPPEKAHELVNFLKSRGVEATIIGRFTDSGRAVVNSRGRVVADLEMNFLHDGLPPRPMKTSYTKTRHGEPDIPELDDLTGSLLEMLARQNIASFEFISQQYDHEVQGGSVIKPLQGRGRVNGDATVTRPRLDSMKALVISHALNPSYSEIDTYEMAACAIDTAVRNSIAAGADLEHLALLDNFCWCSSTEPERLGQLKAACEACRDMALEYNTPFISGKDSMFNDFKGFDEQGKPVKISVPPTLLISSLGVIPDARKAVSIDAKFDRDIVYVLGRTSEELGGSEYFAMVGEKERGRKYIGNSVPTVNARENLGTYRAFSKAVEEGLIASAISVHRGGLATALAKSAIAGQLGMNVDLEKIPIDNEFGMRNDSLLYSESQGRLVVTISPENRDRFEGLMSNIICSEIGRVRGDKRFIVSGFRGQSNATFVDTTVDKMLESYKSTFRDF